MIRITKQPDIRKQELLDIGITLYFKVGEKGISIQQIVKQANVATGLFYYYFKSKEEFLNEALNDYITKAMLPLEKILTDKSMTIIEKLDSVLEAYFLYAKKMETYRLDKVFQTKKHFTLTDALIKNMHGLIEPLLIRGKQEGIFTIQDCYSTGYFILHGLSCVFNPDIELNDDVFVTIKQSINKLLEINKNENYNK